MTYNASIREIDEELAAMKRFKERAQIAQMQVDEFKQKLVQLKKTLADIKLNETEDRAKDMQEVCLFTVFQCARHIGHIGHAEEDRAKEEREEKEDKKVTEVKEEKVDKMDKDDKVDKEEEEVVVVEEEEEEEYESGDE